MLWVSVRSHAMHYNLLFETNSQVLYQLCTLIINYDCGSRRKKIWGHMSWGDKGKASITHDKKAKDTLSAWMLSFVTLQNLSHIRLQTSETPFLIVFFFLFFFCSNQLWLWDSEENTIKCTCWQYANFPGSITRLQIKGHCHKQNCQSSIVILSIKVKVSYIINKY